MNKITTVILLLAAFVILTGIPGSFAQPQYLTNLSAVYGDGSCGTCHIRASGGGPLTSYGTLFMNQSSYATDPSAALRAIGAPSETPAVTPITPVATVTAAETRGTPGFGFVVSLIGLFSWALLRRHSK
ncbi:MAG: hypothetical protein FIB08_08405 [Candidatus Methanoperedens sp.]|nr:hypothetical protein [Candidatus Methanoperedens sp.]